MTDARYQLLCIGNSLVDITAEVDDSLLASFGCPKGSMNLIEEDLSKRVHSNVRPLKRSSGGSAANTAVIMAMLGGRSAFIGKVRRDELGLFYDEDLKKARVVSHLSFSDEGSSTGTSIVLLTPDRDRTFMTHLGVSALLDESAILPSHIRNSGIVYMEGYICDREPGRAAFRRAIKLAKAENKKTALSLSDTFCVDRNKDIFAEVLPDLDFVFGNEDEVYRFFGSVDEAKKAAKKHSFAVVMTRGPKGAMVLTGEESIAVATKDPAKIVDKSGAGDSFAGGFLYGLAQGMDMKACATLGDRVATQVISHFGARPETLTIY